MAGTGQRPGRAGLVVVLVVLALASCGESESGGDVTDVDGERDVAADGDAGRPVEPTEEATATILPGDGESPEAESPEQEPPDEEPPDDEPSPAEPEPTALPDLPPGLLGQDIEWIPTSDRVVALTFDAGANANAVQPILNTLAAENVPGTFFLTGDFVNQFPSASRSIHQAGHRLGNHSVSHPNFTSLTADEIRAQVRGAEEDISRVTGGDPRPFFRFPFGDRDARTISAVNDLGYLAVRWTTDTLGWQGTSGGRTAADVTERVLDTARPGQIVLMHVGSHPTDGSMLDADALPDVIAGLRDSGYRFVTLDALLGGSGT